MEIYEILLKKIKKKYKNISNFANEVDMSKQLLSYHLENLEKGNNTFRANQLKVISDKLDLDLNFFYK